ncbi:PDZ domain-containing protein [Anaerobacillus sp. MEB173]|uniref:PDZ domain-containing protein n=1 Tax=Anaerobacillus sp. MEB173 TaxID=3383345 RepID=UPI003F90DED6
MVNIIAVEILKGIGSLFLQPLFYIFLIFSLLLGVKRVKRERQDFNTRIYDSIDDVLTPLGTGLLFGLGLTIVTLTLGIVMPIGVIVLLSVISLLFVFSFQMRWFSPAITVGLVVLLAYGLPVYETGQAWLDRWILEISEVPLTGLVLFLGASILFEGMLIAKKGGIKTSPKLLSSRRGKVVGVHEGKRLWILPTFFLLPQGAIPDVGWWPILSLGDQVGYGLILVPIGIGFHKVVQSNLPNVVIKKFGMAVFAFGLLITALAVAAIFYYPLLIPVVALVAMVGRFGIDVMFSRREAHKTNYFSDRNEGIVILAVIPKSPADKMGLKIGEVIKKVNGKPLTSKKDFYHALQINSAFCKLEVLDKAGEIRFAQTAVYEDQHHQIGVVFAQEKYHFEIEDNMWIV